jgi:hypothetical protein
VKEHFHVVKTNADTNYVIFRRWQMTNRFVKRALDRIAWTLASDRQKQQLLRTTDVI